MWRDTALPYALYSSMVKVLQAFSIFALVRRSDRSKEAVVPPRTAARSQGAAPASPGCSSTRTLISAAVARRWRRRPLIFGWANEDDSVP